MDLLNVIPEPGKPVELLQSARKSGLGMIEFINRLEILMDEGLVVIHGAKGEELVERTPLGHDLVISKNP